MVLPETGHDYLAALDRQPQHGREWVNALRARGLESFRNTGFPTRKQEEWRDTSITPIIETPFVLAEAPRVTGRANADSPLAPLLRQFGLGRGAAAELVFLNGHFQPALSTTTWLPTGVHVQSLAEALAAPGELLEQHLGHFADIAHHPFAALNTAAAGEGALLHIARDTVCPRPIHLLFLSTAGARPTMSHPRLLVIAEENSESSIVETYAGDGIGGPTPYFTNAVTEILVRKNARIDHNKLQQESPQAFHIALMQVILEAASSFVSHSISIGSHLTRNDLQVSLAGERAEATLNGLVYARGEQHIDNHTLLHHEKGHCPSHELYKHVLADKSTAVFKGKIFVQKDAQKTDSKQTSKALLLSNEATMNSQPALEIYADDVKCTHGSTTGPVDENAVFYLVSRGLSLAQARHLMTYAFAADITRRIKVPAVRARIEDFMATQHGLPQDLRITEEAAHDVALL